MIKNNSTIIIQSFQQEMSQKLVFSKYMIFESLHWWTYANKIGQCFNKLSLNAASCKTANNTESISAAIELELKDIKDLQMEKKLSKYL